jgi:hypothetical protein
MASSRRINVKTEGRVSHIVAFAWGVVGAGALAVVCFAALVPAERDHEVERWRGRAYEAEQKLAAMRTHLESLAARAPSLSQPVMVAAPGERGGPSFPSGSSTPPPCPPPSLPPVRLDPPRQEEWDALVSGTLQAEVERRLGRTLSPGQEQRLLDTLSVLREASLGLREAPLDPEDPRSLRDHLTRTIALLEADRTFRDELGIGVSDFLQGLDEDQIEEISPIQSVPKPAP